MTGFVWALYGITFLIWLVANMILVAAAFRTSLGWGFASVLLAPFSTFIFLFSRYQGSKINMLIGLVALPAAAILVGNILMPMPVDLGGLGSGLP